MKNFLMACTFLLVATGLNAQNQLDFEVFKKSTLTFANDSSLVANDWLKSQPGSKVVFFWATWCGPCVMEMEAVKEGLAAGKIDASNVYFISDEKPEKIAAFIAKRGMAALNIVRIDTSAQTLGIMSIPFSVALNKNGEVEKTETGYYNKKHTLDFVEKYGK